jgi:hypothetical protein
MSTATLPRRVSSRKSTRYWKRNPKENPCFERTRKDVRGLLFLLSICAITVDDAIGIFRKFGWAKQFTDDALRNLLQGVADSVGCDYAYKQVRRLATLG